MKTTEKQEVEEGRGTAKIPLKRLVIFFAVLFALSGCEMPSVVKKCPDDLPPGYYLEQNQHGLFRPLDEDGALFWIDGPGTRCDAIISAWDQYDYDNEQRSTRWTVVK